MSVQKLVIGFIGYGDSTARYLPYFLPSLLEQTYKDFTILVIDNSEKDDDANKKFLAKFPEIDLEWAGENIGFARAYNKMIRKSVKMEADYFLMINPDMILEPDVLEKLVSSLDQEKELAAVCPKILQWNFANKKTTKIIDSCGIGLKPGLRFYDIGQNEFDQGQHDHAEILGPSGAAAMWRLGALEKIKQHNQYFDELMFMYKEDCDLGYRAKSANFKGKLASEAIVYHDRTTFGKGESNWQIAQNRFQKDKQGKKWTFLNQHIIFLKYWRTINCVEKIAVLWHVFKIFAFVLLFEQYLLKQYFKLWKIRHEIIKYN